ncbi:MAG: nucleotidyltransferase family protein [bacterium]|nr:nucleotidyltransferase family protein [bacterium]
MTGIAQDIGAVVLAAGQGRRIGRPKAFLSVGGVTFLQRVLRTLSEAGISNVVCVVSPAVHETVESTLPGAPLVVNPDPDSDMMTSLRLGIAQLSDGEGCFAVPVDHPFVRAETYRELMAVFKKHPEAVVLPVYQKRGGHPALLPLRWARGLPDASWEDGLRGAMRACGVLVMRTAVDDPGVLRNVNTLSDLPEG